MFSISLTFLIIESIVPLPPAIIPIATSITPLPGSTYTMMPPPQPSRPTIPPPIRPLNAKPTIVTKLPEANNKNNNKQSDVNITPNTNGTKLPENNNRLLGKVNEMTVESTGQMDSRAGTRLDKVPGRVVQQTLETSLPGFAVSRNSSKRFEVNEKRIASLPFFLSTIKSNVFVEFGFIGNVV